MNFITNINILFANYIVLGLDFTSSDVSNYVTEASGNTPSVITSEPIPLNEWVNVVAVADAAAQRFFFIIYLFILAYYLFISAFLCCNKHLFTFFCSLELYFNGSLLAASTYSGALTQTTALPSIIIILYFLFHYLWWR